MTPLLKSLLGNGSKDRELTEEMRAVLTEMQEERDRYEALLRKVQASAEKLQQVGEPLAKVGADVDAMYSRFAELEQRAATIAQLSNQFQNLDERAAQLTEGHQKAQGDVATTLDEAQRLRTLFEDISGKIDAALALKDRLEAFVEVDKPFQELSDEARTLRGQVDGTGEQLARLREQHDRLLDAHKLAVQKMEALDRRRDDLFPGDLGFDDALQPLAVFVLVVGQIERPLERRDHLLGELHFLGLHRGGHGVQFLDRVDAADFGGVMQRVHHNAALLRAHGDEVLAAVEGELADPDLALHAFAHDSERVARHFSVRR